MEFSNSTFCCFHLEQIFFSVIWLGTRWLHQPVAGMGGNGAAGKTKAWWRMGPGCVLILTFISCISASLVCCPVLFSDPRQKGWRCPRPPWESSDSHWPQFKSPKLSFPWWGELVFTWDLGKAYGIRIKRENNIQSDLILTLLSLAVWSWKH